jgi:hypothetical protein
MPFERFSAVHVLFTSLSASEGFGEGFSGGFGFVRERDFDAFDKDVGMSAAETGFAFVLLGVVFVLGADVLEVVEAAHDHFAAGGGAIVFEHREEGLEEECKIRVGEAGFFGDGGRDVAFGGVEAVGDDVLVAHGALLLGVLLLGDGAASDRDL